MPRPTTRWTLAWSLGRRWRWPPTCSGASAALTEWRGDADPHSLEAKEQAEQRHHQNGHWHHSTWVEQVWLGKLVMLDFECWWVTFWPCGVIEWPDKSQFFSFFGWFVRFRFRCFKLPGFNGIADHLESDFHSWKTAILQDWIHSSWPYFLFHQMAKVSHETVTPWSVWWSSTCSASIGHFKQGKQPANCTWKFKRYGPKILKDEVADMEVTFLLL